MGKRSSVSAAAILSARTGVRQIVRTEEFWQDEHSYYDQRDFRAYKAAIERLIHTAGEPLTIRAIHALLGDAMRREWTMDALDMLDSVEIVSVLPTRYAPRNGVPLKFKPIPAKESLRRIFPPT